MDVLKFTGNPFIDNGAAVITAFCKKNSFNEVSKEDILENLDNFFDNIKFCYNYENASPKELKYSKRGLKQHLLQIYTTNHYLHGINNYIKNNDGTKKKVSNFDEYKESIRVEIMALLNGRGAHVYIDNPEINKNICRFCGKNADILLSKDIFPMLSGKDVNNLGLVYCCNNCYISNLFYYINMVNIKKDETSSGFYMLYECSNEKVLIEMAKMQLDYLRNVQLGSLKTYIGNHYESLIKDMENKLSIINRTIRMQNLNFTVYFIINDNRGASYNSINIPDGVWRFMAYASNANKDWERIKHNFQNDDYKKFIEGDITLNYFNGLIDCLKIYLKEVRRMNENLINAVEGIGTNIIKLLRLKGDNWPIGYEKEFSRQKPYEFLNSLFNINEEYFKVKGENLFSLEQLKLVISNSEKSGLIYSLAKYFIYNSMNNKERACYVEYCKNIKNINEEDKISEN